MNGLIPKTLVAALLAVAAVPLTAAGARADASGAKSSFTFPATCTVNGAGSRVQFVVNSANGQGQGTQNNLNGQANFTPALVVGTNQVFHPTSFNITFTFTPIGGPTYTNHDTATQANGNTSAICTINYSVTDAQGTFSIIGSVLGFFS